MKQLTQNDRSGAILTIQVLIQARVGYGTQKSGVFEMMPQLHSTHPHILFILVYRMNMNELYLHVAYYDIV